MFRRYERAITLTGGARLAIRFRAMRGVFDGLKGRGRWRQRAVEEPRLRYLRQTQLGRVPGWAPKARIVGPWRPVELIAEGRRAFAALAARDVALTVIVSQGDRAIDELKLFFGDEATFARAHGPAALARIKDADHNLTAPEARRLASCAFDAVIARMIGP